MGLPDTHTYTMRGTGAKIVLARTLTIVKTLSPNPINLLASLDHRAT